LCHQVKVTGLPLPAAEVLTALLAEVTVLGDVPVLADVAVLAPLPPELLLLHAASMRVEPTSSAAPVRILCMGFPLTSSTTAAGRMTWARRRFNWRVTTHVNRYR
jgi:hypothetical protein